MAKFRLSRIAVMTVFVAGAVGFSGLSAQAFKLLSHRAVYELSLLRSEQGSINHAEGRLVIEWAGTCEGYTTEQRMMMRVDSGAGSSSSDFQFSSWESNDGDQFRYDVKTTFGGQQPEVFKGRADRGNGVNLAAFKRPADLKIKLPKKVVFPSEHIAILVDGASKGERHIAMPMFDGTGQDGLVDAIAFVTGPAPKVAGGLLEGMGEIPGWKMQLSFFDPKSRSSQPIYMINFTLYSNGVAGDIEMDYSRFAVRGKLTSFKSLGKPDC